MHAAVVSIAFLVLHGLLWYARPAAEIWLAGSLGLVVLWGIAFMRLITREKPNE